MNQRASGILLPVSALPGAYGVGTLGADARNWIDFLVTAGQRYWQILPLVPPGGGDSPYMSPTSFGGNPYFIDLEELCAEGLLTTVELEGAKCSDPDRVDYPALHESRLALLRLAWERGQGAYLPQLLDFLQQEGDWLNDYTLFMALREQFDGAPLKDWPEEIRLRQPDALAHWSRALAPQSAFYAFLQLLFFRQWKAVKQYANERGISIIGDLPIYVSPDSAEVWANPRLFLLRDDLTPAGVAGVPPDAFTDQGQHWGNPLYDWGYHRQTGFSWWRQRGAHMARLYDVVRIDHFRAFHTYWYIPEGAQSAKEGHWEPGPGMALLDALKAIDGLHLIAEDLGDLDEDARAFIAQSGLPGMKVLIYAFDPAGESAYLPHNCPGDCVVYTGTHDTPTFVQWLFDEATTAERAFATDYLRLRVDEGFGWGAVKGAWMTTARLAIAPMQDLLGLGADGRMNTPGTMGAHNWSWRVRGDALNAHVATQLLHITHTYRRD